MTTAKKIVFYGRAGTPVVEQCRQLHRHLKFRENLEQIEQALSVLDGKPYVSSKLVDRIVWVLTRDLKIGRDDAENLIGQRFGYNGWTGFKRSKKEDEAYHKERARNTPSIAAQLRGDMRSAGQIKKDRRKDERIAEKVERLLQYGTLAGRVHCKPKTYFFFQRPEFVVAIEDLMVEHTDYLLEEAVKSYPYGRMTWEIYRQSFGIFWRKVQQLHTSGKIDFSEPGLKWVKQLSHCLYSWNFRRYMDGEVIFRYARSLPRQYRAIHVAAVRDINTQTVVDVDYPEMEFEEDPDDNIGNR